MKLSLSMGIGSGSRGQQAPFSLALTGLTGGEARPGATIGYTLTPAVSPVLQRWGTAPGDATYGTGANPTDFSGGLGGNLVLGVTRVRNRATGSAAVTDAAYWPTPATQNGVTRTVVASGALNGEQWVEYRFQGTPTAGNNTIGYATVQSRTPAAIGQTWTGSARLQVVAGDPSRINVMRVGVLEETAPSTLVGVTYSGGAPTDGTENLATAGRTLTTGNQVRVEVNIVFLTGQAVDVTVRTRGLQLEQGTARGPYQANFSPTNVAQTPRDTRTISAPIR